MKVGALAWDLYRFLWPYLCQSLSVSLSLSLSLSLFYCVCVYSCVCVFLSLFLSLLLHLSICIYLALSFSIVSIFNFILLSSSISYSPSFFPTQAFRFSISPFCRRETYKFSLQIWYIWLHLFNLSLLYLLLRYRTANSSRSNSIQISL